MTEVRICEVSDVVPDSARRFDVDGYRLCVARVGDSWYVIGDECSHADYSLSEGEVWPDECEIECPKHGSTFALATGIPQSLPATKPVPTYDVRLDATTVMVTIP